MASQNGIMSSMASGFTTPDKTLLDRYLRLTNPDKKTQVLYVWVDSTGEHLKAKTKTMGFAPKNPSELPIWDFYGAPYVGGEKTDIYLHPVTLYKDPFRSGDNNIVLCDVYKNNKKTSETNHRRHCLEVMNKAANDHPWFGMEQEYILLDTDKHPYGWPKGEFLDSTGPYSCGVGTGQVFGRDVVEAHYKACLYAGINIYGSNAEAVPSQWEFQVGPCEGITIGDDLWMARFILHRVAEDFNIIVSLDPKPLPGHWHGAGLHANFSTSLMRADNGIVEIEKAIDKLSKCHAKHIRVYDPKGGNDNVRRLTGRHDTSSIDVFSAAVSDRDCSIRIPRSVSEERRGYLEDRRPASNADPYMVSEALVKTICLND